MRTRNYTLDREDKPQMRRLYPDVIFDWKTIARQLAKKREACRCYRSRRRPSARLPQAHQPFYAVFNPAMRTIYADVSCTDDGAAAVLDAILSIDRALNETKAPLPASLDALKEPAT